MKAKGLKAFYVYIIIVFWISPHYLYSQELYFSSISNTQNLPSLETYNIIQDSKGYIWICTENGLVKYSRDYRKIFDKLNGLGENSVYYINEYKKGEIELFTSANRFLIIRNDSIQKHKFSSRIKDNLNLPYQGSLFDIGYLINRNTNNDLILNSRIRTFRVSEKKIESLTDNLKIDNDLAIIIMKGGQNDYFIKNNPTENINRDINYIIIKINSGSKNRLYKLNLSNDSRIDWRNRIANMNGSTYFTFHDKLLKIDDNLNIETYTFPAVITSLYVNSKHGLWIGVASNGLFHYPDPKNMKAFSTGLKGLTVSGTLVDNEGGTWCTTTEKGVFYSSSYMVKQFNVLNDLNKKTTLLKTIEDRTFISTQIDNLQILEQNKIRKISLIGTGNSDVVDIIRFKNKIYLATKGYMGVLDENFKLNNQIYYFTNEKRTRKVNITAYQLDKTDNFLYVLTPAMLLKVQNNKGAAVGKSFTSKARCFKILNDEIAYLGCADGLYMMNIKNNNLFKIQGINSPVSKIISIKDSSLLIATKGQGLFRLTKGHIKKINLGENNYLLNDIIDDKYGNIWISTSNGILKLTLKEKSGIRVINLNESNGLISKNIGKLTISDNQLIFSSSDGLGVFPITIDLINKHRPNVYINSILVNDKPIDFKEDVINLTNKENSILFNLDFLSYKKGKDEKILYSLKGLFNEFRQTNNSQIYFENLPPENYELVIYGVNNDGLKSEKPLIVRFTIQPAFWQMKIFLFLMLTFVLLIAYFLIRNIIQNIKEKEREKTKIQKLISESQIRALQAQMNPHFIFNAINSIQNYILNKKEDEAYDYLARFSKLIRMVLNNSRENWISIKNELETLEIYVQLEQLRFQNNFEYFINIDESLDTYNTEIPAMIVQTYVENAIWHGIMNLETNKKGLLQIDFSKSGNTLKIVVEDNGVGRKKSNEFKNHNYKKSLGMQLVSERIKLANEQDPSNHITLTIIDLYDDLNNPTGTRVEIYIMNS